MEKYYKERFEAQMRISRETAPLMEVNKILEKMRVELKNLIPLSMEACILLLDPEAGKYTRPLQCSLYNRPVNCLVCKRNRKAIQKAVSRKKGVVASNQDPIIRHDGSIVEIGPEAAIPVIVGEEILAAISIVSKPDTRFTRKDFYLIRDFSEFAGNVLLRARKHWEGTQEKIRISQMLNHLSPFVPMTVRNIVEKRPELLEQEKESRDVSVLFLDLEGYTGLSEKRSETEVNELVEMMFSEFVDPIHRSQGEINETAGDGLMIIFSENDPKINAENAVKAAFDILDRNRVINERIAADIDSVNVKIGINSGNALLGLTRFKGTLETRMTYTATGPVTNLAARLASHARGGDILIGKSTKELIEDFWPVFDRGEARLKGLEDAVRIYSLINQ